MNLFVQHDERTRYSMKGVLTENTDPTSVSETINSHKS